MRIPYDHAGRPDQCDHQGQKSREDRVDQADQLGQKDRMNHLDHVDHFFGIAWYQALHFVVTQAMGIEIR